MLGVRQRAAVRPEYPPCPFRVVGAARTANQAPLAAQPSERPHAGRRRPAPRPRLREVSEGRQGRARPLILPHHVARPSPTRGGSALSSPSTPNYTPPPPREQPRPQRMTR